MRRITPPLLAMALVAALLAAPAWAREGRLDRGFGDHGRVVVRNSAMAVGPGGSIALVVKRRRVVLLTRNGDRDPRFGHDGSRPAPARAAGWSFRPLEAAVDGRGRVLIFGTAFPPDHRAVTMPSLLERVPISRAAVLRLLPDGRLDPSFGRGGAVVGNFGMLSEDPEVANLTESTTGIAAGTVDALDRPLFVVSTAEGVSPCVGHGFTGRRPGAIVRLTPAGLPDPGFGGGDGLGPSFPEFAGSPVVHLALSGDDQPLMGGERSIGCPRGASVIRLGEDGTALPGYGTEGRKNIGRLEFLAFTPEGGAILERRRHRTEILRRMTPQGALDPGFGHDGTVTLRIPPGADPYQAAAVDPEGRVLFVRAWSRPASGPRARRAVLVVERLLPSGRVDRGFGRRGRLTVPVPGARNVGYLKASLDQEGRLLVLGEVTEPEASPTRMTVITRLLLDRPRHGRA